ncbi:hypothetical protein KPL71_001170 [Citrus sinensis]|uniref:Uncharacterized protein n=1 Tax=Citrus sinensis TaxID=2711 RepID=A0ACB8NUL2_CITSI|nr:hypothetical protein KPL71_001170 [Citrus sinensis]
MNRQLPFKALNQRNFPMNISFQSAYQLQDFAKKFLYRFFFNVQTKNPDRFPNLCMEHLFLTGLTLSSLSISEDELWYMWCLTTLYATKLVFPIKPVLTHLTTPEFSPDLLWTLFEWYSPLTWWRQQLQHLSTFHGLDKITYPHPYTFIHDTSVTSVLKAYLMELNNVPPPATNIHHTSIGPSHTLEIIPKTQGCTPGSSSSPHGILVMEQRPDYTNVLFQDAQDPWEDFQSLLHTDTPRYTVTNPDSPAPSTSQHMSEVDEEKYQQAEAYLDQRQRRRHKRQYEKDTGDSEQYVTMEIPSDLVANWKREGYTHLHLGGVRLILTLHGRKGLLVTARIALLDTRFKEYQHAVVGTVLTTLHAGSVLLTFYPNFNLSFEDPNLPTTLKVQIQLQGAEQTPTSKIATLHHQIVYRLQNHAIDLPTPYTTSDALMILADTDTIPTIIQIPKQILKQDLLKLMPLEWLTNYEHFHQNSEPGQTTEATFNRRPNGQVKLSFQAPDTEPVSNSPQLSYTAMITAVQTGQEKKLPIHGFSSEGYPVYPDKINGHFLWDVPEAHMCNPDCPCLDDTDIDEELEVMRRKKKKKKKSSHPLPSCKSFLPQPPPDPKPPAQPIRSNRLDQMYLHLQDRISELDADLRRMINNHIWGPEFNKKEAEIRKLKAELSRIDAEKARPSLFTQPQPTPVSPPIFETYAPFCTPSRPQQPVYNQFFGFSHLQPTPQPSSPKKSRSKIQSSDSSDSSEPETNNSSSTSPYDSSQASTDSESEYADITGILMATETADPSASTSTPIVDDNPFDQASQTEPIPPPVHEHSTKPSSASWFTFDDIPRHKWAARLQEFAAWIDLQGTKPNAQPQAVLREFMARSMGSLRDWLESLGEYRQLQFMESPVGTALNIIHEQFIGEKTASTEADRKEYHQMKCCSLKRHLLDAHYKRMSILFYKLNGFNEPSLKHVFIASLPPELQPDLQRKLTATNLSIADISLGKIFQMAMLSLDKICEQFCDME